MAPLFVVSRARRALTRLIRQLHGVERRLLRLAPVGDPRRAPPVGAVLLSYVVDPFLAGSEPGIAYGHTQDWECWAMAAAWRELGFAVDAIHWTNDRFVPGRGYDVLIDPRRNLERLAPCVGSSCLKIFHAETAHWRTSDAAQLARLEALADRRGVRLRQTRLVGQNRGIESADCATVLGNDWTLATYRPFGKPLYRVPLSNAFTYPSPAGRDFEQSRRRFLWFGGVGFVHKGLDLVLEAFAGMPELELWIAAPLDREREFVAAFERELFQTPNIRALGWLDVGSPRFLELADQVAGTVFPSCSEGGGGSVITAMHAGLIPIVTRETSVDLDPSSGIVLTEATVERIRAAARDLAARPVAEIEALAVEAWRRANRTHTRAAFARNYRVALGELLARFRPDLAERCAGTETR